MDQNASMEIDAFLLTRRHIDTPSGLVLEFWAASGQGPVRIRIADQEVVFFAPRDVRVNSSRSAGVELKTLEGVPVRAHYFQSQKALAIERERLRSQGFPLCESDIKPADRYLMERFITGPLSISGAATQRPGFIEFVNPQLRPSHYRPELKVASIDIETEGLDGALYSIAIATRNSERVFMLGHSASTSSLEYCPDERSLMEFFFAHLNELDPDVLVGWNVIDFDLRFLARVCQRNEMPFAIGRDGEIAGIPKRSERVKNPIARVSGRAVLEGVSSLRSAMYTFEDYSLEAVAQELLGRGKLVRPTNNKAEEITRLYHESPEELAAYNIEDCRLVLEIFQSTNLIGFELERASLNGLTLGRQGGSVAAFDYLYLPRLHRQGFVAPDPAPDREIKPSPGGYVMDSIPGLHRNVLVLDFKSLYPSIIRTFHIDPLAMAVPGENPIPGFDGASFSRDRHILPGIIEELWWARLHKNCAVVSRRPCAAGRAEPAAAGSRRAKV